MPHHPGAEEPMHLVLLPDVLVPSFVSCSDPFVGYGFVPHSQGGRLGSRADTREQDAFFAMKLVSINSLS